MSMHPSNKSYVRGNLPNSVGNGTAFQIMFRDFANSRSPCPHRSWLWYISRLSPNPLDCDLNGAKVVDLFD